MEWHEAEKIIQNSQIKLQFYFLSLKGGVKWGVYDVTGAMNMSRYFTTDDINIHELMLEEDFKH